jgi:hypothetical protein
MGVFFGRGISGGFDIKLKVNGADKMFGYIWAERAEINRSYTR